MRQRLGLGLRVVFAVLLAGAQARAAGTQDKAWTDQWFSDVSFGAQIEGGVMGSSSHPANNLNFGQLLLALR